MTEHAKDRATLLTNRKRRGDRRNLAKTSSAIRASLGAVEDGGSSIKDKRKKILPYRFISEGEYGVGNNLSSAYD